jgi:hypothetical protein
MISGQVFGVIGTDGLDEDSGQSVSTVRQSGFVLQMV